MLEPGIFVFKKQNSSQDFQKQMYAQAQDFFKKIKAQVQDFEIKNPGPGF